jgi:hypothetical protein
MCTYLTVNADVAGSGLGRSGWFPLERAVVYYDHPQDAPVDHALCIDFRSSVPGADASERVAVELDAASARRLAASILRVLDDPDAPAEAHDDALVRGV